MILKPIRNEEEYDKALEEVDRLMELNPPLGSKEGDELEVLVLLIEKYEEKHWAISEPDPIEAIKIRMQQMNLKQKDLVPYIGNRSKVSELLNRKISLSLTMIINLASGLHLPFEALIQPPNKTYHT
ncbi:MAG: HTH-type transcriptional regulator / antitoxin HigA [Campylobacterota bacterium]|nr:HTH-type transcriptional regulator / antitoxin HigA [Campylobacterota bacterium]MDQ1268011.1 HTH-type transcriptional regulator / antitoxin HigA [Campylobacterota bacterium]MDQ1337909.1 HTH-type transcriptional regulator / antitoxin HigA [Campylobacterota bacterium]